MKELSLNILDIAMNSVKAKANSINLIINEDNDKLEITIDDDGCGMTKEQVEKLSDPFYTTRTTRKVGLGVPFYKLAAEQTGGYLNITSVPEIEDKINHGTSITAFFNKNHIDFTPLGDIISTVVTLLQGNPEIDFCFSHTINDKEIKLSVKEINEQLGEDIPINTPEVLAWIKEYITEQYESIII